MRPYLPIVCVALGFAAGVASAPFFSIKSNDKVETPVSAETAQTTPSETSVQPTTPTESTLPQPLQSAVSSASPPPAPVCPNCPCLFSNEILDPPKFDPRLKEVIETNAEGEALIRWMEVPGAKKYAVHVETENGKSVKIYKGSRSLIFLKDIPLPEGKFEANYFVRLATVNGKDEEGPLGPRHALHVKPQANVMAPAIQEIKVED